MPLTFIHAADFHLGAPLKRFGPAAARLQAAQGNALEKTLAEAERRGAACVLICGDLFDTRFPRPAIRQQVHDIFRRHPACRIVILPGTHDFLSAGCIYDDDDYWAPLSHITVLNDSTISPWSLPGTDIWLYFRPNRSNKSAFSPIEGIARKCRDGVHIGLAHGSLKIAGWDVDYDFPLDPRQVAESGLDYLALGHWHRHRHDQFGSTLSVYSGTPQPLGFSDPPVGMALAVTLGDSGHAEIEPFGTGDILVEQISEKIYHPQQLRSILEKASDKNKVLKLVLTYSDNFNETEEVAEIIAHFTPGFLQMLLPERIEPKVSFRLAANSPEEDATLSSGFLAELERLKAADSAERAELYDKAAELGLRLIRGDV